MKKKKDIDVTQIYDFICRSGSDHLPTFGGTFEGGINAQQVPMELASCLATILESGKKIESFLEIGAAAGGTTFLVDHFLKPKNIVLIDDNRHPKAHVRPYILRDVKRQEIIGDSQHSNTVDQVEKLDLSFDLLLIDGDHSFPGVKKDFDNYFPIVKVGGFILFHDSALINFGVYPFVNGLKLDDRCNFIGEFINDSFPRCGLALFEKVEK